VRQSEKVVPTVDYVNAAGENTCSLKASVRPSDLQTGRPGVYAISWLGLG